MWRALAIWIAIFNLSSTPLYDAMLVVEDDAIELGSIECGESRKVDVEKADSVRVVFRLGDEWIGTDILPMRDTIEISDLTETFEVEIFGNFRVKFWKLKNKYYLCNTNYICLLEG